MHALLMCRDVNLCALRLKFLTQPVNAQAVSDFLLQYDNILFFSVSENRKERKDYANKVNLVGMY